MFDPERRAELLSELELAGDDLDAGWAGSTNQAIRRVVAVLRDIIEKPTSDIVVVGPDDHVLVKLPPGVPQDQASAMFDDLEARFGHGRLTVFAGEVEIVVDRSGS